MNNSEIEEILSKSSKKEPFIRALLNSSLQVAIIKIAESVKKKKMMLDRIANDAKVEGCNKTAAINTKGIKRQERGRNCYDKTNKLGDGYVNTRSRLHTRLQ